jgi:hypothetical protein|tara:strand:- start:392 stop:568 length:177 start_codon:yes stop_codon:yes gene_type:complete
MTNNPLDGALINCNKNYQRITQERKPVVTEKKLKNVTPIELEKRKFVQLEFNFDGEQQ